MQNMLQSSLLQEFCRVLDNMYRLGWDERNGGNVSLLLNEEQIAPYLDTRKVLRSLPVTFDASALSGRVFLATGAGSYFRNMLLDPERNCGVFRVADDGRRLDILWGFSPDGAPTSETPTHLMCHAARLRRDPEHRVALHAHPPGMLAMTFVHPLDDRSFTRSLWRLNTECMVVFPDGVGVLPWMLCGTDEIGVATAAKMRDTRMVVWAHHGLWGTGSGLDEAFGLVETAEKHAQIYLSISHLPRLSHISDDNLREIAAFFGVTPRAGFLD